MTPPEAAAFLAAVAAFDGRNLTEANAHAWASSLHDVTLADALEYLPAYYRTATRDKRNWLMPGDVVEGVTQLQHDRILTAAKAARDAIPEGELGTDEYTASIRARAIAFRDARDAAALLNPIAGADLIAQAEQTRQRQMQRLGALAAPTGQVTS